MFPSAWGLFKALGGICGVFLVLQAFPERETEIPGISSCDLAGGRTVPVKGSYDNAVAMGAQQEGAVHASVRKGLAMGITREELEQVVALAAGTLGFPQTVAAYTWIKDLL